MTAEAYSQIYEIGEEIEINISSDFYKSYWVAGKVLSVGHSEIGKITYWVEVKNRKVLGINYTMRRPTKRAVDVAKPTTKQHNPMYEWSPNMDTDSEIAA
jgi:hypothetical protein